MISLEKEECFDFNHSSGCLPNSRHPHRHLGRVYHFSLFELGNTAFPFWLSLLSYITIDSSLGKVDICSRDSASWDWNIFGLSDPSNSFTGLSKVFDLPNRFVVCISSVLNTTIWLTIGVWGMFKASSRLTVDKVLFIEAFSICSSRSIWRALKTISRCVLGSYYF